MAIFDSSPPLETGRDFTFSYFLCICQQRSSFEKAFALLYTPIITTHSHIYNNKLQNNTIHYNTASY
jgi:hypothetical protein